MELLFAAENVVFTAAIVLMLALTVLEGLGLVIGAGMSEWLEHLLPDVPEADGPLGWLHLGKVPLLMLLIIFLTSFGLLGLVLQAGVHGVTRHYLPAVVAVVPAFLGALPVVRVLGGVIARVMPRDESSAVSEEALVGRAAIITIGIARAGQPAQAKLRDQHGQTHYVMVEPDVAEEAYPSGTEVLLVKKLAAHYRCIRNPHPELL